MFEKLLALLAHGKAAAAAGVLVVGTSGMVVSGTFGGQDVNLTLTPLSQEVTTEQTTTEQSSPLVSETQPTNEDGTESASPDGNCSDEAHARNVAKATVKLALDLAKGELETLGAEATAAGADRKDVAKVLRDAKKDLDGIRRDGQQAVQEAADLGNCKAEDDEDGTDDENTVDDDDENTVDEDETTVDEDETTAAITLDVDTSNVDEQYLEAVETAIEEMELSLNAVAGELAEMTDTESTEQAAESREKGKSEKGKSENKGKGNKNDD